MCDYSCNRVGVLYVFARTYCDWPSGVCEVRSLNAHVQPVSSRTAACAIDRCVLLIMKKFVEIPEQENTKPPACLWTWRSDMMHDKCTSVSFVEKVLGRSSLHCDLARGMFNDAWLSTQTITMLPRLVKS